MVEVLVVVLILVEMMVMVVYVVEVLLLLVVALVLTAYVPDIGVSTFHILSIYSPITLRDRPYYPYFIDVGSNLATVHSSKLSGKARFALRSV